MVACSDVRHRRERVRGALSAMEHSGCMTDSTGLTRASLGTLPAPPFGRNRYFENAEIKALLGEWLVGRAPHSRRSLRYVSRFALIFAICNQLIGLCDSSICADVQHLRA